MNQALTQLQQIDWAQIALTWLGALLLFVIGLRIARWVSGLTERALMRAQVESTAVLFLRKVAYVILMVVLILAVLQVIGVPMTSMIAVVGAAGLAVGLALKDSLSNIASGVMLVSLKPFRAGDVVTIAGKTGRVESVSIFQTRLRGTDNQTIVLPNSLITTDAIINLTPDTMRRIELQIGISYQDNIAAARATALEVIHADTRVLAEPSPDVLVYALGDDAVQLGIRCHVHNSDFFVTKCELTERIKVAFDQAGIRIPFPQRDVHLFHHRDSGAPALQAIAKTDVPQVTMDDPAHQPDADPQ